MNITQFVTGPLSVNTWCIPLDSRRIMVVDPGGDADVIITHISEQKVSLAAILLTHGHFDHLTGLPDLVKAFPGVPVAIHPDDAMYLGAGALERHCAFLTGIGAGSLMRRFKDELPPATILLADGQPLILPASKNGTAPVSVSGEIIPGWKVLHTPGHSPGSVCFYNAGEGILLSGDTLFNSGFGRTDAAGGSFEDLERSLGLLFALPPETLVLPGHGPRTTIGSESGR